MMDKPFEALFGFIHVLPGAFSGYRWESLKKVEGESILDDYLKTVNANFTIKDLQEANMYLAEDRILCLKIYSKFNRNYSLSYIPNSTALVDPVTTLTNMMGQRRRWINGSWFALEYVLDN
jgi:chitin synthase